MLRFFRHIRQNLFLEGRVSKYLGYALGEIVLIVAGILIAVQINNWNQERADRDKESILLAEVHNEFLRNKDELNREMIRYGMLREKCETLIQWFPIDPDAVDREILITLFDRIDAVSTTDLTMASISAIGNSSSFEIISDEELRSLLFDWYEMMSDYNQREARLGNWSTENLWPFLDERIPMDIMDDRVDLSFMSTIQFENLIKRRDFLIRSLERKANNEESGLVRTINRIIELSAPTE